MIAPTITPTALARAAGLSRWAIYKAIARGEIRREPGGAILHKEGVRWIKWRTRQARTDWRRRPIDHPAGPR